jgi:hypothetical protein
LFIGNGPATEGAPVEGVTEILTQFSNFSAILKDYNFKGSTAGFVSNSLTVRTYQDKLDDRVSVRDFGAVGDGVADDTLAIKSAITELYRAAQLVVNTRARRTLFFPAGTYNISADPLPIPPYFRMVGDGIFSTIIRQTDPDASGVIRTTDSLYQIGALTGANFATLPEGIEIENLTLQHTADVDVALLDSIQHVSFSRVNFLGPLELPTVAGGIAATGARMTSRARKSQNITFDNCNFTNTRYALISDSSSADVRFVSCYFSGLFKALRLGQNGTGPTNYRIFHSTFSSIASTAIDCYQGVTGVVSSGNHFLDVGNGQQGQGNPIAPVISFVSDGNSSMSDVFDRTDADALIQPRVAVANSKSVALGVDTGLILGPMHLSTGAQQTLLDNTTAPLGVTLPSACTMRYRITRAGEQRQGTLKFITNGVTHNYMESYTETLDIGVALVVDASGQVTYATSSTGIPAVIYFNVNYLD